MELEVILFDKNMIENKNKRNGFTLIELLVALAVFSLIVSVLGTTTVLIIKAQRKAFAIQSIQEPARYVMEIINREIRLSDINSSSGNNLPFLNVTNFQNETIVYQFVNNKIQRQVDGGIWQNLSPDNLEVTGSFYIINESFPKRAKVTVVMEMKMAGSKEENSAKINLQSAVTPRSF